jgi:hypothetical protein
MVERAPVSAPRPIWYDSQQVDETDLTAEQVANETIEASIIDNHVGDGILPEVLVNNVLFDSSLAVGNLDGLPIFAQAQPSDPNYGNQLAISLTNSLAAGTRQVKVCIIGLDFQDNLQYEVFYFETNEIQVSRQHFTQVLLLLFNDLVGNPTLSFNLGGDLVIYEASPMTISRDVIMIAQDQQPSLFWRDFFLDPSVTQSSVQAMIQAALPLYDTADLNIYTTYTALLPLNPSDVTTQIGQKFQTTTNNIQKVTLLLSVPYGSSPWLGDIVVSIYPLQVSLDCPTDLVPNLPIDYSPSNIPYAQISYNYNTLFQDGIQLNSIPQPVDFIFSNSAIATGNVMSAGQYCAVTIKRSGCAGIGTIYVASGSALLTNSWVTTFSGNLWVDITNDNLWFRVWTDAAKVTDGQAYDAGNGVTIPKTTINPTTQATIDNVVGALQFTSGQVFSAVLSAITQDSVPVPDQRTGNPVDSRQQFEPQITLLDTIDLTNLEAASNPLVLGIIADQNVQQVSTVAQQITVPLYGDTMANNEILIKIIDDPTDPRYNSLFTSFVSSLLMGNLESAMIIPDTTQTQFYYRIASAQLETMLLGDVDGNGIIDENDVALLNTFLGYNFNIGLPKDTLIYIDGYLLNYADGFPTLNGSPITTLDGYLNCTFINGYETLIQPFANLYNVPWLLVDPNTNLIVADGYDGVIVANPASNNQAQFTSASVNFNNIIGLSSYNLVILSNGANMADWGGWSIVALDSSADVLTIQKIFLDGNVIEQMIRADINGDFAITYIDGYLLENYVNKLPSSTIPPATYPAPSSNPYTKIGKPFQVVRLTLEEFVDRNDDYAANPATRALSVHPPQDIFASDGYLWYSHNYFTGPLTITITPQLVWDPSLVVCGSQSRYVPAVFPYETGFVSNSCVVDGVQVSTYPVLESFDPGRVDVFCPNNIIIGNGGQLQTTTGDFYKVDWEVGTIVLEIPDGLFGSERTIDLVGDFIATTVINGNPTGLTALGYPAMRYADCSFVGTDALANDQLRFSVSVQSFSPNTNGLSPDGYYGIVVDGRMGVSIDYSTGFLTINFTNLYQDPVLQTLSTKVQVNVFLKQGGFNNTPLFVNSTQVGNMLSLISVFSGANEGGASALVELGNDVSGVLPLINGGTGLNSIGVSGTVLTSNGSGVSYQFITAPIVNYTPTHSANWNNDPPTTVQQALDRIAAMIGPIL